MKPPKSLKKRVLKAQWKKIKSYTDIELEKTPQGVARLTINRPKLHNAFRPLTVKEMKEAIEMCREDRQIGVLILRGKGTKAFCAGGDQKVRTKGGYADVKGLPHLNILDVQKQIRSLPKPVIASIAGYAIGGGHVLHVVCDISIAAENARFGQTGPKVGSFDGGLGSSYLSRIVGQKKAREIWFLCRQYSAKEALDMGLVNKVVPLKNLEEETLNWALEILKHSPMALRCLKAALNADCDGQMGLMDLSAQATLLYYLTNEAEEGKKAFLEKREPDFSSFPRYP